MTQEVTPVEIRALICSVRGKAVILDSDLAVLYQVTTKRLNEAVRRNRRRFPDDFMFQLSTREFQALRSHLATSNNRRGGRRYLPYVFTEQGVAMLSGVLTSEVAIDANIRIMRAFVQIKRLGLTMLDLRRKVRDLESKYDQQFSVVFDAIHQLLEPPATSRHRRRMGFGKD